MPIYVVPGRNSTRYHTDPDCSHLEHVEAVEHPDDHALGTWYEECGTCRGREDRPAPGTDEAKEKHGKSPQDVIEAAGLEVSDS